MLNRLDGHPARVGTADHFGAKGARQIRDDTFEMEGIGDNFIRYTFAQTKRAKIKGFTLIWPAGDEPRRARVVQLLKDSFTPIEGIVDPTLVILPSKRLVCS